MAALQAASGTTVIELQSGDYGSLVLDPYNAPWANFSSQVTIKPVDASATVTFTGSTLRGVTNLTIEDVTFKVPTVSDATAQERAAALNIRDCTGITISGVTVTGVTVSAAGDERDGLPGGYGIVVRGSNGVVIEDSTFTHLTRAATFDDSDNLLISGNDISDIRSDGLDFAQVTNVTISGNYIHDFTDSYISSDHRDMIQFWTAGTTEASSNILITENILDAGDGAATHSIFMRNELVDSYGAGTSMYYQNVVISNNVIHNFNFYGIMTGASNGLVIENNTLILDVESGNLATSVIPQIWVSGLSTGVLVTKNIAGAINATLTTGSGWSISDNLLVQYSNPLGSNYVGSVISNAFTGALGTVSDWVVVSSSAADTGGYGADLTHFTSTPASTTARMALAANAVHDDTFSFTAALSAGPSGVYGSTALYTWDFGDGTYATGLSASHVFGTAGRHYVVLTVQDSAGNIDKTGAWIYTPDTVRFNMDAIATAVTNTAYGGTSYSDIPTVADGSDYAIRISDTVGYSIDKTTIPDAYSLNAFTLSLNLKAMDGANSIGEILRIMGGLRLNVQANGVIQFVFTNSSGSNYTLNSSSTSVLDGQDHALSITYDSQLGRIVMYLDGTQIGTVAASGETPVMTSWGLTLGAAYGKVGFDGLIDDIKLVSDPAQLTTDTTTNQIHAVKVFDFSAASSSGLSLAGDASVTSQSNKALHLDGSADYALLHADDFDFGTTNKASLGLEVTLDPGASGAADLIWKEGDYGVQIDGTTVKLYLVDDSGAAVWTTATIASLADGASHKVGLIMDGTTNEAAVYVDGQRVIDRTDIGFSVNETAADILFGAGTGGSAALEGTIDTIGVVSGIAGLSGSTGLPLLDSYFWALASAVLGDEALGL